MASWSEHTVHANGVDIHYWQTGDKPKILLSHGMTDNGRCWQRLAQALEGEYDLLMPDARGHGLSSAPDSGYRPEDRAADIVGLLDALGIERIVAVGHSMGAETSALLAARSPERVHAAILEDPPYHAPQPQNANPGMADGWAAAAAQQKTMSLDELIAAGRAGSPRWSQDTFEPWAEAKQQLNLKLFDYVREPRTDWRTYIGDIQAPTLLITGDPALGGIITPEIASEMASLAPNLRVVQIPGAGHCIRYEQFDPYLAAVQGFLREVMA